MKKVKVLMGIIGKGNGGLSMYMVNLFKKLDKEVFDCTFLSIAKEPYFKEDILSLGGKIEFIPQRNRYPRKHRKALRDIMRKGDFDVCHIHLSSDSNICSIVEAKKADIPLVIAHCHSSKVEGSLYAKMLHTLNKFKVKKLDIERLACSKKAGEFAYGNSQFKVVNNGINLEKFSFNKESRDLIRKEHNVPDSFVLGQLGRLVSVKNHQYTLELFKEISEKYSDSRLLIVGDGPLEEELKQKAKELNLEEKIIFTGNVRNPQDYLCAMDALILPSFFEGFPLVVVEGVCTGLDCFVSDNVTSEIQFSESVKLFSLDTEKSIIAERILNLRGKERLSQDKFLRELGFDDDKITTDMQDLYLTALTGGK